MKANMKNLLLEQTKIMLQELNEIEDVKDRLELRIKVAEFLVSFSAVSDVEINEGKDAIKENKAKPIIVEEDDEEPVEDVVEEEVVNVYPNPAKSVVNVYAENLNKVTVFNSIGQVVYTQVADSDNMIINVESWTNGLYYINLETKDGAKSSQKVIINK
jgi:hypothetical protein